MMNDKLEQQKAEPAEQPAQLTDANAVSGDRVLKINPFAFGASGRPLYGAENLLYNFLAACYREQQQIVEGTREQILDGIQDHLKRNPSDGRWSRDEMNEAIDDLISSNKSRALLIEASGVIKPTEDFGVMFMPKK